MSLAVLITPYDAGMYATAYVKATESPAPGMVVYVTGMWADGFQVTTVYDPNDPKEPLGVLTMVPRDRTPKEPGSAEPYAMVQVQTDGTLTLSGLTVLPRTRNKRPFLAAELAAGNSIGWDNTGTVSDALPGIGYILSRTTTTVRVQLTHPALPPT